MRRGRCRCQTRGRVAGAHCLSNILSVSSGTLSSRRTVKPAVRTCTDARRAPRHDPRRPFAVRALGIATACSPSHDGCACRCRPRPPHSRASRHQTASPTPSSGSSSRRCRSRTATSCRRTSSRTRCRSRKSSPALKRSLTRDGVYLGVGPEQNFTYIANLGPRMAVIFDIRRQNAMQHLMYKALFEMSPTREEFVARLFSRPSVARLAPGIAVEALFDSAARRDS